MNKRHRRPIAATLLTTALLGIGALPSLAANLDDLQGDVLLQAGGDHFTLTVEPYSGETGGGFFVGLTQGFLNDSAGNPQSDAIYMFCVDFHHEILAVPATFNINIDGLLGPDNAVPDAGLGENLQTLQTQALLGTNFGTTPTGNLPFDAYAQFDIWNLNNPSAGFANDGGGVMQALLNAAIAAQPTANFAAGYLFDIAPPPGSNGQQAFMPVVPGGFNNSSQPPTPEPGTLAMLGLGLIGLGSLKLRKSRR
jgi:hypothetical protein